MRAHPVNGFGYSQKGARHRDQMGHDKGSQGGWTAGGMGTLAGEDGERYVGATPCG